MNPTVAPSSDAFDLIERWEGFRANWYKDSVGVRTIGFGLTERLMEDINLKGVEGPITEEEGRELLRAVVQQHFAPKMARVLDRQLAQYQIDALTSFTYNLGIGALERSTLLELYNEGEEEAAEREFLKWVYADGEVLDGLVKRRREEKALAEKDERILAQIEDTTVESLPPVKVDVGQHAGDRDDIIVPYDAQATA